MSEFIMRHFLLCSIPLVSCERRLNTVGLHGGAAGMRLYTPEAFFCVHMSLSANRQQCLKMLLDFF